VCYSRQDNPVLVEETSDSRYVAVFDPLDGSSNIDAAISTGAAFVRRGPEPKVVVTHI
jgi:fructose-1,6-bisphosphatase I